MTHHHKNWLERLTVDGLAFNGARWLMLAALVFAPWAYGATSEWEVEAVNALMGAVLVLWSIGCLLRQSWPSVPRSLAIVALLLIGYAWLMALNAKFDFDGSSREWIPLSPWLASWPGSVHQSASFAAARRFSALLVAVCFVCDMARRTAWRERLLWTLAGNGTALVLFGLAQRFLGAPGIFWENADFGRSFFATYRYHSNAGAFINLTWPLVAGFTALAFMRASSWRKRLAWGAALIICLAGVLVNASRAASVLALVLGAVWIGWIAWQAGRGRIQGLTPAVAAVGGGLLLLLIVAVAAMAGLDTTVRRWSKFGEELSEANPRLQVARVCLTMMSDSGWWGFGPGTWETSFPFFSHVIGDKASGSWEHAHDDYLETINDWGFVGAAGWAVVVFGGLLVCGRRFWRHREGLGSAERAMHFAITSALAGMLLHAVVDFPLQICSLQLCFAALLGVTWAGQHWLGEEEPAPIRRQRRSNQPATELKRSF